MTSYILREPAYHRSAKLSAKLARIDNLGYASDLRLSGQTYNQLATSTAETETQTTTQTATAPTPVRATTTTTESTVGMQAPPAQPRIVGATAETPTVVRHYGTPATDTEHRGLLGELATRAKEVVERKSSPRPSDQIWGSDILGMMSAIIIDSNKTSVFINSGNGGVELYDTATPPQKIVGYRLYVEATNLLDPSLVYEKGKKRSTRRVLTPASNKFGNINIDVKRALSDYIAKKGIRVNEMSGVGLRKKPKLPNRKENKLHWTDKVMRGDNNYVLRNPFLNGRISYYPYGPHMRQIIIRTPSAHALKMVRDMVETGTFDKADYDRLTKDEGDKMNRIVKQSNITIPHDVELKGYHYDEIADLRQRYKVLIGEIVAGNHGKLVLDEMRDILRQLESYHAISGPTRTKLMKQIDAVDV